MCQVQRVLLTHWSAGSQHIIAKKFCRIFHMSLAIFKSTHTHQHRAISVQFMKNNIKIPCAVQHHSPHSCSPSRSIENSLLCLNRPVNRDSCHLYTLHSCASLYTAILRFMRQLSLLNWQMSWVYVYVCVYLKLYSLLSHCRDAFRNVKCVLGFNVFSIIIYFTCTQSWKVVCRNFQQHIMEEEEKRTTSEFAMLFLMWGRDGLWC